MTCLACARFECGHRDDVIDGKCTCGNRLPFLVSIPVAGTHTFLVFAASRSAAISAVVDHDEGDLRDVDVDADGGAPVVEGHLPDGTWGVVL